MNNQSRLNILQIISGLDIGGAHGGAERFGLELARQLARQHSVEVCAFWQHGTAMEHAWIRRLQSEGIHVFYATHWEGAQNLKAFRNGLKSLSSRYPSGLLDIAHSHFQLGSLAAINLKRHGQARRALRTAHVAQEWGTGWRAGLWRQVYTNWVFPFMLDSEVGVSRSVATHLRHRLGARLSGKAPCLIFNAIPLAEVRAASYEDPLKPFPPMVGRVIGSVGRMTAQKDFASLLLAAARIVPEVPALKVVLIGDGEQRPALEALARQLGISRQVYFLGQRPDVPALLRHLELFVLPSLWEGLPTAVMESMAVGVPVLATAIPGTDELVVDGVTGWVVSPGNHKRLARVILYALRHPEFSQSLAKTASEQMANFQIEPVAAQYTKLYYNLLARGKINPGL